MSIMRSLKNVRMPVPGREEPGASSFCRCLPGVLLVLLALPLAPAMASDADNWPGWRGPGGLGIAAQKAKIPTDWSADKILWKTPIEGQGHSSPAVWGNRIFLTTAIEGEAIVGKTVPDHTFGGQPFKHPQSEGGDKVHTMKVVAVDAKTGKILWSDTVYEGPVYDDRHQRNTYASPTVAVDGERVFSYFGAEGVYVHGLDGELVWSKDLGDIKSVGLGVASSPVVVGDVVIIQADEDSGEASFIVALDKKTGEEVWRREREVQVSWTTPLVHERSGVTQLITVGFELAIAYDPATGKELWKAKGLDSNAIHAPLIIDDQMILTSGYPAKVIFAMPLGVEGDQTGKDLATWRYNKGTAYMPSNVLYDGLLYLTNDNGVLTCLDARTGEVVYEGGRSPAGGRYAASLIAGGGHLLMVNMDGDGTIVKAGREFEVVATPSIDEPVWATPAVIGSTLYLRGISHLYAIEN